MEPSAIESAIPSLPSMLGWFVPPRVTSRPLAITEVSRAADGGVVWGREVACGAVSGKSLARARAWSSLPRTPAPSARQPLTICSWAPPLLSSNDYGSIVSAKVAFIRYGERKAAGAG
jgi:hypothetical protein